MKTLATITIQTAMAITDRRSKRTWMRRIEEGTVRQIGPGAGVHTLLALDDVLPATSIPFDADMRRVLIQASMGHAEAQAELGQLFCELGIVELGAYWLKEAAGRGSPEGMHSLALLHSRGAGVPKDDVACMHWLSFAADLGHVIAQEQLKHLPGSSENS